MNAAILLDIAFTLGSVASAFWLGYGAWLCLGQRSYRKEREALQHGDLPQVRV